MGRNARFTKGWQILKTIRVTGLAKKREIFQKEGKETLLNKSFAMNKREEPDSVLHRIGVHVFVLVFCFRTYIFVNKVSDKLLSNCE